MRIKKGNGKISVHAVSGTYVLLLGMDATSDAARGLLGFAIKRTDHARQKTSWLRGYKTFQQVDDRGGESVSTQLHPVQAFFWGDYTVKPGRTYTYEVVPVYGSPTALEYGGSVEVTVQTAAEDTGVHAVYFNRGVAGSQAYARRFGDQRPTSREQFAWLSRGLEEAMLAFIAQADGERCSLRAAVYEFSYEPVLEAFAAAAATGADVKIVYDSRGKDKDPATSSQPVFTSDKKIAEAGIRPLMIRREKNPSYISHNKFIILLRDGEPKAVWTGSTNFTAGGIFGQSNVGHVVRDAEVARRYLDYWQALAKDPTSTSLRMRNSAAIEIPDGLPPADRIMTVFSPQQTLRPLEWYTELMDGAKQMVCFTAAFGVNQRLVEVFQEPREYLRYTILDNPGSSASVRERTKEVQENADNMVAIGATLEDNKLHGWLREQLTGMNEHVKYIHTKYMIIDALGEDPILISGSANFSDASTKNNDENMLVIRGNTRVVDMYLCEFMRLFNHHYMRDIANRLVQPADSAAYRSAFLAPDDTWTALYYQRDTVQWKERLLWRGRDVQGHGITFFDIDETIFHTFAEVWVMKDGQVVRKLTNTEYNTYRLQEGESFDYREFRDAEVFAKSSRVIVPTLKKIKAMLPNALRTGSTIALLTARGTFPDMATFKRKFEDYGIRIDDIEINFAGDISAEAGSVAEAKRQIVLGYLQHGAYKRARLVDDNMENLQAFLSLRQDLPDVEFTAIHIDAEGKTHTVHGEE